MKNFTIDWEKVGGLLPAIVQESTSKDVLMLAYMNKEAYALTCKSKVAHYFSRTKQRIWKKGETSGHIQKVEAIFLDCDNDTLLLHVEQVGGSACHTGRHTCFFQQVDTNEIISQSKDQTDIYGIIDTLYHIIEERKHENPNVSYVAKLLQGKENSLLKKVVEEAGEFCLALKDKDEQESIYEAADLLFHSLVALSSQNIHPDRIKEELKRRFGMSGIEEKNSRNAH